LLRKLEGKRVLSDVVLDERIILKWVLEMLLEGFVWIYLAQD
jgi:hypothetical protein